MSDEFVISAKIELDSKGMNSGLNSAQGSVESFKGKFGELGSKISEGAKNWGLDLNKFYNTGNGIFQKFGVDIDKFAGKFGMKGKLMTAIIACVTALVKLGHEMDKLTANIARGTGAIGEELTQLQFSAENAMVKGVGRSAEEVGKMIADLSTRFGYAGKELEEMTYQFDMFSNVTGTDTKTAINGVADVTKKWGIDISETSHVLDQLVKASQLSGESVDNLMTSLKENQSTFSQLGFSMTEATAMLASYSQQGVNTSQVTMGMKQALTKFASEGKNAREEYKKLTEQIKNATTESQALEIATDIFGTRTAPEMVKALRDGAVNAEDYADQLRNAGNALENTEQASRTAKDASSDLKATMKATFGEFGQGFTEIWKGILDGINNFFGVLQPLLQQIGNIFKTVFHFIGEVISWFTGRVKTNVTEESNAFIGLTEVLKDVAKFFRDVFGSIFDIVKGVFGAIFAIMNGDWALAWENLKLVGMSVANALLDVFSLIANAVVSLINVFIKGINKMREAYNDIAEKMGWKKRFDDVSELGKVDLSELTGLDKKIDETKKKIDELEGKKGFIGDLGTVPAVAIPESQATVDEIADYQTTAMKASTEKIATYSTAWEQKLLKQKIDSINQERNEIAKRLEDEKLSQEEKDRLYHEDEQRRLQQIELYKEMQNLRMQEDLKSVEKYENAEEEKARIAKYYENDIAEYIKKSTVETGEEVEEETESRATKIFKKVKNVASRIGKVLKSIGNGFKKFFSGLMNFIELNPDEMVDKMLEFSDKVLTFVSESLPKLPAMLKAGANIITSMFKAIAQPDVIKSIVQTIGEVIPEIINGIIKVLPTLMRSFFELAGAIVSALVEGLFSINWGEVLKGLFSGIFNGIKNLFSGIGSGFKRLFGKGYATGTNNATRGLHLVGEQGAELVNFKGGERVYNAMNTAKMMKESVGGNSFNVTFNNVQDTSAYTMMRQLKNYQRQMAMKGVM